MSYKQNSAPGLDSIPMQLVSAYAKIYPQVYLTFFNFLFSKVIPPVMRNGSVYTKVNKVTEPKQTRPIGVRNSLMQLMDGLVCTRMQKVLEPELNPSIGGARHTEV